MFNKILQYKLVSVLSLVSILFVLGGFSWAYFTFRAMGAGPFILHFNDISGITAVGSLGMLVFVGAFGLLTVLMNGWIALEFESRSVFFGKLIAILTLVFAVLLFVGFASILSVN